MVTFLVTGDYELCAKILDVTRLNRQIVECCQLAKLLYSHQLLRTQFGEIPFGITMPQAIKLWITEDGREFIPELYQYYKAMCKEWNKHHIIHQSQNHFSWSRLGADKRPPHKLDWPFSVYDSHRSKLLEKEYTYYNTRFQQYGIRHDGTGDVYHWAHPSIQGAVAK